MKKYLGLNAETNFNFDLRSEFTGVGMIRGENLCINKMQYFTKDEFCQYALDYLNLVANEFKNNDVWYRTADLSPHQVNLLDGCDMKIDEPQYLIGNRGVRRNLLLREEYNNELDTFIEAYKKNSNLGILIPFISDIEELKQVKQILKEKKYDGKIGIMVEISSMIFMLNELENEGIDNYTIGVNDLTTSLLCAHRDLDIYNINNKAVLKTIKYIVSTCHSYNKEVTLAGYLNKDIATFANENEIDIINIHYNEIPKIYDVDNPQEYTKYYDEMKARYKKIKNERL